MNALEFFSIYILISLVLKIMSLDWKDLLDPLINNKIIINLINFIDLLKHFFCLLMVEVIS